MTLKHIAVYFSGMVVLGMGSILLFAQSPQPPHATPIRVERVKLRAEVIKLRTEVEMLRLDYEFARDMLRQEMSMNIGLQLVGVVSKAVSEVRDPSHITGAKPTDTEKRQESEKAAGAAKAANEQEKKELAEEAATMAENKKQLRSMYTVLAAKQMDLEDAERSYREASR